MQSVLNIVYTALSLDLGLMILSFWKMSRKGYKRAQKAVFPQ